MLKRTITFISTLALALLLVAGPASAHHKDGHDKGKPADTSQGKAKDNDGDADNDPGSTYTEDNDTNDSGTPNNQPDDGDNAHPSGKDRSVEHGKSSKNPNQGKAESDPDDDGRGPDRSNGGPDKPNGSGGVDKADQDGNNGCGNDDDFEDDNEGWCGSKPKKNKVPPQVIDEPGAPVVAPETPESPEAPEVTVPEVDADTVAPSDEVRGVRVTSDEAVAGEMVGVRGAILPFTGGSVAGFVLLALALFGLGVTALRVHDKHS